jgi:toxin CptA
MAAHRKQAALLIQPRFSRRLATFIVLTHLLAATAVIGLPTAPWRLLLIPIGISLVYQGLVHALYRTPWSIRTLTWQTDGTWTIAFVSGVQTEARLSASTFVSVPLVVLNLHHGLIHRWSLPLFADAIDGDQLRRLRQRLRIEGTGPGNDPALA